MKKYLFASLVVLALGCDDPASDAGSKTAADSGSKKNRDAATRDAASVGEGESPDETESDGGSSSGESTPDGAVEPGGPAGGKDAGITPASGGKDASVPLNDAGVLSGAGSCCEEHASAGCGNADLMVCVCEKDPSCCTTAWGRQCVFIVEQKYCQAGVRDCVCGAETGQWGQTQCCESQWSSTCDSVAKVKCDAVPGCF
jgi:hypothetical protein